MGRGQGRPRLPAILRLSKKHSCRGGRLCPPFGDDTEFVSYGCFSDSLRVIYSPIFAKEGV